MIAITGASGQLGQTTLKHLLTKTEPGNIVAIVRDAQKLESFSGTGIHIRVADYNDMASLKIALTGVEKLLQISTSSIGEQAAREEWNVVTAARLQGVRHIIYTSTVKPQENHHFLSARQSLKTENDIIASGMTYTFFRNSLYLETIPQFIGSGLYDGNIQFPAGDGVVSFVSRIDIGEALSIVMTEESHENKAYEITGAAAFSFQDIATILANEKKLPATFTDVEEATMKEQLAELQMSTAEIDWFMTLAGSVRANEFSHVDYTLEKILQRKTTGLIDFIQSI